MGKNVKVKINNTSQKKEKQTDIADELLKEVDSISTTSELSTTSKGDLMQLQIEDEITEPISTKEVLTTNPEYKNQSDRPFFLFIKVHKK